MSKIAVALKDNMVDNVVFSNPNDYKDEEGWILVESDPTFSIENKFLWTVRESDNKLVHISTGMPPDEETTQANALLGKDVGQAIVTANSADKKADSTIASAAQLGKLIAPLLVAAQTNSNTTNGGTN